MNKAHYTCTNWAINEHDKLVSIVINNYDEITLFVAV